MSNAESKYNIKSDVIRHIKKLLFGPVLGEEEIIRIKRFSLLYSTGILYAQNSSMQSDEKISSTHIDDSTNEDFKISKDFSGNEGPLELAYSTLPSSMGLSFLVTKNSKISISCKAGFYTEQREFTIKVLKVSNTNRYSFIINDLVISYQAKSKKKKEIRDEIFLYLKKKAFKDIEFNKVDDDSFSIISKNQELKISYENDNDKDLIQLKKSSCWKRKPLKSENIEFDTKENKKYYLFDDKAYIQSIVRHRKNDCLITITLVNDQEADGKIKTELNLYQSFLTCQIIYGNILEYDKPNPSILSEEEKINELQFSDKPIYAIAHGTSCLWDLEKKIISTEYLPQENIYRPLFDDLVIGNEKFEHLKIFDISFLADSKNYENEIPSLLKYFCDFYERWLTEMTLEKVSLKSKEFTETKKVITDRGYQCLKRMKSSCELIKKNSNVRKAFILANQSMFDQIRLSKTISSLRKNRLSNSDLKQLDQWPIPYDEKIDINKYHDKESSNNKWRPFQLAFALLVIESLETKNKFNFEEEVLDLIWFSTGGGKTEAYLLVAAYEIFRRRLEWKKMGLGTSVFTRYTYRFLTADQFIRTSRLICSMEKIRAKNKELLGSERITLGLYVGEGLTPNWIKSNQENRGAKEVYQQIITNNNPTIDGTKFQITECPNCGTALLPYKKPECGHTKIDQGYGFEVDEQDMKIRCPNKICHFYKDLEGLPLMVIDEMIYKKRPTFIIGTIDKFANLCWNEEACGIFGLDNNGNQLSHPPSLIIQDELHLISGALGTIAAVYEAGVDSLITSLFKKSGINRTVKYIASTATIKAVDTQAKRLTSRKVEVFPPRGIKSSDTFFYREDLNKTYARTYLGVMPQSNLSSTVGAYYTAAAILEAVDYVRNKKLNGNTGDIDFLWTLLCYCNSKRELGLINKAASDEIPARMKVFRDFFINDYLEQERDISSSKLEISADAINNVMEARDQLSTAGKHSLVPCTNMISVGIDIDRLGLMMVYGQPKLTSEYIQATSRVGRNPDKFGSGLIITYFSPSKPRDRSHYEQFKQYHSTFNKFIEPTSITPGSEAALTRALHASLITFLRLKNNRLLGNANAKNFNKQDFEEDIHYFKNRILSSYSNNYLYELKQIDASISLVLNNWEKWSKDTDINLKYMTTSKNNIDKRLLRIFNTTDNIGFETMRSMRNVDLSLDLNVNYRENNE